MEIIADVTPHGYSPGDTRTAPPPPFGDLGTKELIAAIILAHQGGPAVRRLDLGRRDATIDDARAELRRRSAVGRD